MYSLGQRLVAEGVGTAFLLMSVMGSGIAAETLSPNDVGLQLFENAVATAFALMALIWAFGPISGGNFNPAVTWADVALKNRSVKDGLAYTAAQIAGGIAGAVLANLMFALPPVTWSQKARVGPRSMARRSYCYPRPAAGHFSDFPHARRSGCAGGWGVYRSRLFFHFIDQLCQSGCNHRPDVFGHLCRHTPRVRAAVHSDADRRGCHSRGSHSLPAPPRVLTNPRPDANLTRTRFVKLNQPTVIARSAATWQSRWVEYTSGNHHCCGDEIATPVSSTGSQ